MVKSEQDNISYIQSLVRLANTINLPKCLDEDTWSILEEIG